MHYVGRGDLQRALEVDEAVSAYVQQLHKEPPKAPEGGDKAPKASKPPPPPPPQAGQHMRSITPEFATLLLQVGCVFFGVSFRGVHACQTHRIAAASAPAQGGASIAAMAMVSALPA
jgi:hypothetical protein